MASTPRTTANAIVNKVLAAVAIVLSTTVEWGPFELFSHGTVDKLADA